jgi:tRNA-(ms[2]io[6]A)-hydroxylase
LNTPDEWAALALSDTRRLLNDHAHLEKKAAGNALDLLMLWPTADPPRNWTRFLTAVAKDEVGHLSTVLRIMERRGHVFSKSHRCQYAAELRALVRRGEGPAEVIDRLLVSALIEARSAERFEILGRCCEDPELRKLYRGLWASEHGHYRVFLETAKVAATASGRRESVNTRWDRLLDAEARIISSQPSKSVLHGWV